MQVSHSRLRELFLEFFQARDHVIVPSSPLVPDDPTLLFVNSGMVPFKDTFLGVDDRPYRRAASVQKCLRVTGKHNDLETVGPSPWHHTFFEMLGNFSFGDYFKRDAILYAWEFLTEVVAIDPARLVVTVHESDDEAHGLWVDDVGLPPERVLRMGDATNFWMMADVGPCGPNSEINYDWGPAACTCGLNDCSVALDNGCARWLEIWNLVFMQYDQTADDRRLALPRPGVDTGMGLERLATVTQAVPTVYDTDLFVAIMDRIQQLIGHTSAERAEHLISYRVLADHGRAMTFLVSDGVLPGNEGRAYVLRLIMRRAMRFGRNLGLTCPFLASLSESVIASMTDSYPELAERAVWIAEVLVDEEQRFARTLESGLAVLDAEIARVLAGGGGEIAGDDVFRLYDTYGFPPDLTRIVADEHGLTIDRSGFDAAMAAQRERARAGGKFGLGDSADLIRRMNLPAAVFSGYESLETRSVVLAIVVEGEQVPEVRAGQSALVMLDRTPFYGESGGQVGDAGRLRWATGWAEVTDTQRPVAGVIAHVALVREGALGVGVEIDAAVDAERRLDIMRNHTATHLLHAALREVVGDHAQQRGSLVAPDRLRFDFANLKALTRDEVRRVEARVNADIRQDTRVSWQEMSMEEARRSGATMLFGEKYGDVVRVVSVEGTSRELCGGTHLDATGRIGSFVVTAEGGVGSGLRRIEALTGRAAYGFVRERLDILEALTAALGVPDVAYAAERVAELEARAKALEGDVARLTELTAAAQAGDLADGVVDVAGTPVLAARVEAASAQGLRLQVDAVRGRVPRGVIVLGSVVDGAPRLVAAVSDDLVAQGVRASDVVKAAAAGIGGGGGGRPTLAEAGGVDAGGLDGALGEVPAIVARILDGLS